MYPDSEILFPARSIPELRSARNGETWTRLMDRLSSLPETHEDVLAFSLMMIRLGNCLTCDLDSYRASLGCSQCARRTVQSFKSKDDKLIDKMEEARDELRNYKEQNKQNGQVERVQRVERVEQPKRMEKVRT